MKKDKAKSSRKAVSHQGNSPSPQEINTVVALLTEGRYMEAAAMAQSMTMRFPLHGFSWIVLGTVLMQIGRNADALAPMQKAAALSPDNADVHNNLGITLHNLGRPDEAGASYLRAIEFKPDYAEAHNNLGNTLLELGRPDEAEASYRRALQIKPDYSEAHYNLGITLQNMGRLDEAEASYRRAIEIKPDYAEAHNNLGVTLLDLGRTGEAEVSCQRALQVKPDFAEAHNNLGNALANMNRLDEAEDSYRQAIKIRPDFVDAYSNLGTTLMDLGRIDEAEIFLSKAIEIGPNEIRPLVIALSYIPYQQDDQRFSQLESIYSKLESLPLAERIKLNFAMGKAMENIAQYDRSFRAYEEGNRLHYQAHPFDEGEEERFLENSCNIFTPDLFKECAALTEALPPLQDKRVPIFIVGMLRSGSTLIEQILSSHPEIFGAGELTTFKETLLLSNSIKGEDDVLKLRKLGQEYLDRVWKLAPNARYITDKLPGNYCHLGLIHLMLPNAKIIHAIRDPMDTCFSCYSLRFTRGHEYSYDLGVLGRTYQRYSKLMQHWHNVLPPGRILDVQYEDIVADPEYQAKRMLDYLDLPWNSDCLRFHENKRPVRTASVTQVRKPIYSSSVARWKHFEKHLGPLLEIIHPATSLIPA